ncbi:MAG: hypothetical protein ABR548_08085 [Actinomycetota bacterium]|nr:hypothetical protein [Actinomycetota bacterium]
MTRDPIRVALALLLFVSAALFVAGSIVEHGHTTTNEKNTEKTGETGTEATESTPHVETGKGSERIFGLDLERPGIVAIATVLTLALAATALLWRDRKALMLILLFAIAFAVLDVREAVHQNSEGRTSVLAIASVLAAIHVIAAGVSGAGAVRRSRGSPLAS